VTRSVSNAGCPKWQAEVLEPCCATCRSGWGWGIEIFITTRPPRVASRLLPAGLLVSKTRQIVEEGGRAAACWSIPRRRITSSYGGGLPAPAPAGLSAHGKSTSHLLRIFLLVMRSASRGGKGILDPWPARGIRAPSRCCACKLGRRAASLAGPAAWWACWGEGSAGFWGALISGLAGSPAAKRLRESCRCCSFSGVSPLADGLAGAVVKLLGQWLGHRPAATAVGPEGPSIQDRASLAKGIGRCPADPRLHPAVGGGRFRQAAAGLASQFSHAPLGGPGLHPRGSTAPKTRPPGPPPTSASMRATVAHLATVAWTLAAAVARKGGPLAEELGPGDPVSPAVSMKGSRLPRSALPAALGVLAGFPAMLYHVGSFRCARGIFAAAGPPGSLLALLGPA